MKSIKLALVLSVLLGIGQYGLAQEDSVEQEKNLRFSALGGPGFSPDAGVLLGGSLLFTFSTDPADTILRRSVVPVALAYFFNGGGTIIMRPQVFLNHDRMRLFGEMRAVSIISHYYGVGYETNKVRIRSDSTTQYRLQSYAFNPVLLFRYKTTDFFWGVLADINADNWQEPSAGMQEDVDYLLSGGDNEGLSYFNLGLGIRLNYDTRDIPANAYSGKLIELEYRRYFGGLGSTTTFDQFTLDYRQYQQLSFLGKRKVLAWTLNGNFTAGDVPLSQLATIGSAFNIRGYFDGQFRDQHSMFGLIEYRNMFNFGNDTKIQRIGSKLGFAVWTGVGVVNDNLSDFSETRALPNYGAGLRIELQPRMNFRVDMGRDVVNGQTLVYLNMTEAF